MLTSSIPAPVEGSCARPHRHAVALTTHTSDVLKVPEREIKDAIHERGARYIAVLSSLVINYYNSSE